MSHCEPKAPFCNIWHIWAKYLFWCDHSPSNWSNTAIFILSQWPLAMRKHHVDTSFEKWQWPDMPWPFPTSSNVTSHIFHAIWANPSMNQWSTSSNQMSLSIWARDLSQWAVSLLRGSQHPPLLHEVISASDIVDPVRLPNRLTRVRRQCRRAACPLKNLRQFEKSNPDTALWGPEPKPSFECPM